MANSLSRKVYLQQFISQTGQGQEALRRQANLYDAIAARVSIDGFRGLRNPFDIVNTNNPLAPATNPVPPEEVLFRRANAPVRYMEDDIYFANENLSVELPDSDLLKALHSYVSDFYEAATPDHGRTDWFSMDETALIALGILLEESAISSLEKTGDMVLVEGVEDSEQEEDEENEAESTQEEEVFADAAAATARKRGWSKSMPVSGWEDDEDVMAYERTAEAKGKRRKMTKEGA